MMSAPVAAIIAMKLPMLFMSFFEAESNKAAHEALDVPMQEAEPEAQARPKSEPVPVPVEQLKRAPDALIDGIEALGEFVLALDAQLRAERTRSTALRVRLNRDLAALRKALQ
jgi:hypothetical protein